MIWPFHRNQSRPMCREYEIANLEAGSWITRRTLAGDASAAAEKLFPCAHGFVLATVLATGEKLQLHRGDQLSRWEIDDGARPMSARLRPPPPTVPTCLPPPRPLLVTGGPQ